MEQYEDCVGDAVNSRTSVQMAGWDVPSDSSTSHWQDRLAQRVHPKWDSFSWLTVRALYESVNDVFAKAGPTIVRGRRARWVAMRRTASVQDGVGTDFVMDRTDLERPRFIVIGDPGEADASQYAVVDPLLAVHRGEPPVPTGAAPSDFMVIVSDVIYPAGDVNEYVNAFYLPYREYDRPIYALPGNHDWYDGLNGFMFHFCAAEPVSPAAYRRGSYGPGERATLLMWRKPARPDRDALVPWMNERARRAAGQPGPRTLSDEPNPPLDPPPGVPDFAQGVPPPAFAPRAVQPAPYFAIDTGPLLIVSIDTGVAGELDATQGEWLRRVSSRDKPKLLLTGKPIYVDNEYHPCPIVWKEEVREAHGPQPVQGPPSATADDIVRHPDHGYVAVIGGDVHNYQRYAVRLTGDRTIFYFVSGGGGAYLSATHSIPKVGPTCDQQLPPDVQGFDEDEFRCYPLRGDSLKLYTRSAGPLLFKLVLSAPVLVLATLAMMLLVLGELGDRRLPVLLGSALGAVIVALAIAGFALRDKVIAGTQAGYRGLLLAGLAGLIAVGAAAVMVEYGDAEANSAAGLAIAVPFALVAAMLLAYTLRDERPEYAPALLVVGPIIALWEIFSPLDVEGGWALAAYVLLPVAFVLFGVWLNERARLGLERDTYLAGHRILVIAAWALLTFKVLWDRADPAFLTSHDWLTWTMVVLVATGLLIGYAIPRLTPQPHRPNQSDQSLLREVTTSVVVLALIVLALHGLAALGDGWPGKVTALAFSTFAGIVGAVLLAAILFLVRGNPLTLWHMRTGGVDAGFVAQYMATHVGGGQQPVRPVGSSAADERSGMVDAVRRLGKVVSEIAESNEPPFYKSFLDVAVEDERLVVRCYGVTGYSKTPTLEDCVSIPFPSDDG